jgi:hypothetical protein
MTRRPEQVLHGTVVQHLEARAAPGLFWFHCPNGGWRSPHEAAIFKALGVKAGIPDLLFLKAGKLYALELKADHRRKPTPHQLDCHARMKAAGATVAVACSLDSALAILELWGLLRGVRQ